MNCPRIEKLLPLYAGSDLSERDEALVRAHLTSCEDCRQQAAEFQLSLERLQNFAAPDFGEEFYANLRGAVLSEITSGPARRPSIFGQLFPPRPALAFSLAALVLMFGALSFVAYRSLSKGDAGAGETLRALENSRGEFDPYLFPEATGQKEKDAPLSAGAGERSPAVASLNARRQGNRREGRRGAGAVAPQVLREQGGSAATAVTQVQGGNGAQATDKAPVQAAIARMEIQTGDPNIRIIWLGRKASE